MSGRAPPDPSQWAEASLWLSRAQEDIAVAQLLVREEYAFPAAFHTQQALEKLLKALLAAAGEDIRRTHDLDALATEVRPFWPFLIPDPFPLVNINRWYLTSRYPGGDEGPPPLTEIVDALHAIEVLVGTALAQMTP